MDRTDNINYNPHVTKYWMDRQFGGKLYKPKWKTFSHNGVMFPPEFKQHNVPVIYNGKQIQLQRNAEEYATLYARYTDTDYIKNKVFKRNFWKDWKKVLGKNNQIIDLDNCDFSLIYNHILKEKEKQKILTKEQKEKKQTERLKKEEPYKYAIVDGVKQPTGNFRVEPPGIFIGRGCHPKLGKVKKRIYPEDITINIGKEAQIPETLSGHKWGKVIHNRQVEWLAAWKDTITGKTKYVWLGAQSHFKAESDRKKFDLARKLKKKIRKFRNTIEAEMDHKEESIRQVATALYFIDKLALRVGNEKSKEEADTVGVTSLRAEHIKLLGNDTIHLSFLGKDSVLYTNKVKICSAAYKNLINFIKNKSSKQQLFDKVDPNFLNGYLQTFMKGLTAKVFRTFNASCLFQRELIKVSRKFAEYDDDDKINQLLSEYNKANLRVAILCNHRKKVSKSFNSQIDKLNQRIKSERKKLKKITKTKTKTKGTRERIKKKKELIRTLKAKKTLKIELKDISLETSKANYIDPRITISFMKKHNLPIEKVFSKTLQEKFRWAFEVDKNWTF